ncbi:MAG TPA: hypothetical protein VGM23_08315 [Armatimonadota bacterium]|jgi:hypothetical protein
MNVATAVYTSVDNAEDTVRALRNANFPNDHLAVITRSRDKGLRLADDLGRDYHNDAPSQTDAIPRDIYANISPAYVDIIHRSDLPDDAISWYRQRLDAGDILVIVNVENRMEDADHILTQHGGILYRDRAHLLNAGAATAPAAETGKPGTIKRTTTTTTTEEEIIPESEHERRHRPAA